MQNFHINKFQKHGAGEAIHDGWSSLYLMLETIIKVLGIALSIITKIALNSCGTTWVAVTTRLYALFWTSYLLKLSSSLHVSSFWYGRYSFFRYVHRLANETLNYNALSVVVLKGTWFHIIMIPLMVASWFVQRAILKWRKHCLLSPNRISSQRK